jgi:hypothetical protein
MTKEGLRDFVKESVPSNSIVEGGKLQDALVQMTDTLWCNCSSLSEGGITITSEGDNGTVVFNIQDGDTIEHQFAVSTLDPVIWSVEGELPEGLELTQTGILRGTLKGRGFYQIKIRVVSENDFGTKELIVIIRGEQGNIEPGVTSNWLLGRRGWLSWNETRKIDDIDNLPTSLDGGVMQVLEGVLTMSDNDGNLLFYSNGMTIWNKNHQVMSNGIGLTGHDSSAQSGIVIHHPIHSDRYIVFTIDAHSGVGGSSNGLYYSVVDMTLNGGLGGVISNEKNIKLVGGQSQIGEHLVAVKGLGDVYWIVAGGRDTPSGTIGFNVWKVDSNGVNVNCQGIYRSGYNRSNNAIGYLRFSLDGTLWAAPFNTKELFYGTFDVARGIMTLIKWVRTDIGGYGCEFSTDSSLVYVSTVDAASGMPRNLSVFKMSDLMSLPNNSANVTAAKTFTPNGVSGDMGAIQLALDGRIYGTMGDSSANMYVVENINDYDNIKVTVLDNFITYGGTGVGLPNFVGSFNI